MKAYTTLDGEMFRARGAADLISQMRGTCFYETKDDAHYMEEIAKRILKTTGNVVRTATPQEFVADLLQHGFVREGV